MILREEIELVRAVIFLKKNSYLIKPGSSRWLLGQFVQHYPNLRGMSEGRMRG
jgi:hypothetical protein